MPKRIVPLSELQVRNAKPRAKEYKLTDGGGLYLLIPDECSHRLVKKITAPYG